MPNIVNFSRQDSVRLDSLYERYGFRKQTSKDDLRVYVISQGYFYNADVVPLRDNVDISGILVELQRSGFACQIRHYTSYSDAEEHLFRGFFAIDATQQRLSNDYERFKAALTKNLGGQYLYVDCPYIVDGRHQPDSDIVSYLVNVLSQPKARLVVVEAAAGYGKTCTAYEVLSRLLRSSVPKNPIFTELSRNRQARTFRYVLLDEIDRNYSYLKLDLVQAEIQNGRLPLIIDGFDELLYRTTDANKEFEDAESMLDTIGNLLKKEAKVLLTTRKTAIFDGDNFHQWMESRANQFEVIRVVLGAPTIASWLGNDRVQMLRANSVPVADIDSPVLLTFLRNVSDEDFSIICRSTEKILEKYFTALLEREQERQALRIDAATQLGIFRNLARTMLDLDFTAASRDFIKYVIIEENRETLSKARKLYGANERPSLEQLGDTLAGHVLLDRVGRGLNSIGFINDFVLGIFVGDVIRDHRNDEWIGSERMIDVAVTAYKSRDAKNRGLLWEKLQYALTALDAQLQLTADFCLRKELCRNYEDSSFESLSIQDCSLGPEHRFQQCLFVRCVFTNVVFYISALREVTFLNCKFYNCSLADEALDGTVGNRWVKGCVEEPEAGLLAALTAERRTQELVESEEETIARAVLHQFWLPGKQLADMSKAVRTLFLGMPKSDHRQVSRAIDKLEKEGIIRIIGEVAFLNRSMISVVRDRLNIRNS